MNRPHIPEDQNRPYNPSTFQWTPYTLRSGNFFRSRRMMVHLGMFIVGWKVNRYLC